jgi:hypothetical protein
MTQAFTAPQIVMAIFDARGQAEAALQGLRQRGFSEDQLSVLVRHDDVTISAERMAAIDEGWPGCSVGWRCRRSPASGRCWGSAC